MIGEEDALERINKIKSALCDSLDKFIDSDWTKITTIELSSMFLRGYFQGWGQSVESRRRFFNKMVDYLGVKDIDKFRARLNECYPLGKVEKEDVAIEKVIVSYLTPKQ